MSLVVTEAEPRTAMTLAEESQDVIEVPLVRCADGRARWGPAIATLAYRRARPWGLGIATLAYRRARPWGLGTTTRQGMQVDA